MSKEEGKTYLNKNEYEVRPIHISLARELVINHHYARGCSKTATHCFGLFNRNDPKECLGAAMWLPPIKPAAVSVYPEDFSKVVSLSRLVVVPGLPTNAAGFLVAGCVRAIRKEKKYKCLLTYADGWQGHTGTIYKATNWEYLGERKGSPTWIDPATNKMVSIKATRTRTRAEMQELGYKIIGTWPKHKYRLLL